VQSCVERVRRSVCRDVVSPSIQRIPLAHRFRDNWNDYLFSYALTTLCLRRAAPGAEGEAALFRACDGALPAPPPRNRASQSHPVAVLLPQGIAAKAPVTLVLARLANRLARPAVCHLPTRPAAILAAPPVSPIPVGLNHRHGSRLRHTALAQPSKRAVDRPVDGRAQLAPLNRGAAAEVLRPLRRRKRRAPDSGGTLGPPCPSRRPSVASWGRFLRQSRAKSPFLAFGAGFNRNHRDPRPPGRGPHVILSDR